MTALDRVLLILWLFAIVVVCFVFRLPPERLPDPDSTKSGSQPGSFTKWDDAEDDNQPDECQSPRQLRIAAEQLQRLTQDNTATNTKPN
jgi:hypothetical protein